MKNVITTLVIIFGMGLMESHAQSFAKSLGLYVFPANNQSAEVVSQDDAYCYNWAREQSGYDPINPPEVVGEEVDTSPDGSMLVGGAGGAAAGAAIGAIAGDAGKGAAIGAVVGGLRGRRAKVVGDARQQQANNAAAGQYSAALEADFKKAYSACMGGKGYTVQ
ncbi:MAG: glycine zipper domain-containing protein [Cyclobacteriaceae bacterium]